MEIRVNVKHMGKRKKSVEPRTYHLAAAPSTVRELILAEACFEDGIYRIFLDDRPLERLDEEIGEAGKGTFTFVRLTMLSGRLW